MFHAVLPWETWPLLGSCILGVMTSSLMISYMQSNTITKCLCIMCELPWAMASAFAVFVALKDRWRLMWNFTDRLYSGCRWWLWEVCWLWSCASPCPDVSRGEGFECRFEWCEWEADADSSRLGDKVQGQISYCWQGDPHTLLLPFWPVTMFEKLDKYSKIS